MADNSSSCMNDDQHDLDSLRVVLMAIAFIVVKFVLVLPLALFVLHVGLQRRRQRSSAGASHSDVFACHSAAVELTYTLGVAVSTCGSLLDVADMTVVGLFLCSVAPPSVICFNILTCVERYLAVVQPVLYLRLRQSGGARIRNASIGCVWLLCFGWVAVISIYSHDSSFISLYCLLGFAIVVVSFCSLSVLCVLIRPGPGEKRRDGARVDQPKQRAFYTVTAILGVLLLGFFGFPVTIALSKSCALNPLDSSLLLVSGHWWSLPSILVLPVLFLQRAGKLVCCQH